MSGRRTPTGAFLFLLFQHDSPTVPFASGYVLQHSLNDLYETTGSGGVQRGPALVVPSVDVTPTLHQELDHLCVLIDASLPDGKHKNIGYSTNYSPVLAENRLILVCYDSQL